MSSRLKLTVAYDGAAFAGWQSQAHGHTAQDQLDRALHKISGQRVRVHGAGRTDTGVHALAQCAHVDLPDRRLSVEGLARALNAILPPSIDRRRSGRSRSEEHTSELQSLAYLVCRLLLQKKNK